MRKKRPEFSPVVKKKVVERSGNRCERCGIKFIEGSAKEFHHIIPVVFGGDNSIDNCSLLCYNCHRVAPNIRNEDELLIYKHYFLRFTTSEEAAEYYGVDNKLDLYIKAALDIAKKRKKK